MSADHELRKSLDAWGKDLSKWSEELTTEINAALAQLHNRLAAVEAAIGVEVDTSREPDRVDGEEQ